MSFRLISRPLFTLVCLLSVLGASVAAESPRLVIETSRGRVTLSAARIQSALPARHLTVRHPDYPQPMSYLAYPVKDIFKLAGVNVLEDDGTAWIFHCADGYKDTVDAGALDELDVHLAIGEDGVAGKWSMVKTGKGETYPGPFLALTPGTRREGGFTWPYAVVSLERISFARRYAEILPRAVEADSAIMRGFHVFRYKCLRCHSINLRGGTLGPELNIPRNISEYRERDFLRAWIADPGSFRARARMPALGLSPVEIDDVIAYLEHMREHKIAWP